MTFVYGHLTLTSKRRLWEGLHQIAGSMTLLWLLLGDFNSPLSLADKQGGLDVTTHATVDFQEFMLHAGIEDLHSTGCRFTWTNGRVVSKLDQTMVNVLWLEQNKSSY